MNYFQFLLTQLNYIFNLQAARFIIQPYKKDWRTWIIDQFEETIPGF